MYTNSALLDLALWISGIAFIFYGSSSFVSKYLQEEFLRYGFDSLRPLIGGLQILGGLSLLIGSYDVGLNYLVILAAGGLSLMMLIAILVRIKIGDTIIQSTPAIMLFLLNGVIVLFSLNR